MNIFIVNQNPDSIYNDKEGARYEYPTRIPCGKMIKQGDVLLFNLAKKVAIKLGYGDKRITGIAKIKEITIYNNNNKEMAVAEYTWYRKFKEPITFNSIGGDPRINENNSMNKIEDVKVLEILIRILELYE